MSSFEKVLNSIVDRNSVFRDNFIVKGKTRNRAPLDLQHPPSTVASLDDYKESCPL